MIDKIFVEANFGQNRCGRLSSSSPRPPNMSLPKMNLQIETKSGRKMEKNTDKARASVSKEPSFMAAVPDGGLNVQIASKPLLPDKR